MNRGREKKLKIPRLLLAVVGGPTAGVNGTVAAASPNANGTAAATGAPTTTGGAKTNGTASASGASASTTTAAKSGAESAMSINSAAVALGAIAAVALTL